MSRTAASFDERLERLFLDAGDDVAKLTEIAGDMQRMSAMASMQLRLAISRKARAEKPEAPAQGEL